MKATVKFFGVLRKTVGKKQVSVEIKRNTKLKDIIQSLTDKTSNLKQLLIDPELGDIRPNAIVLLNGKELSALDKGLGTRVHEDDEIVLIPVVHGG